MDPRELLELLTGMTSEEYARYLLKCIEEEKAEATNDERGVAL